MKKSQVLPVRTYAYAPILQATKSIITLQLFWKIPSSEILNSEKFQVLKNLKCNYESADGAVILQASKSIITLEWFKISSFEKSQVLNSEKFQVLKYHKFWIQKNFKNTFMFIKGLICSCFTLMVNVLTRGGELG